MPTHHLLCYHAHQEHKEKNAEVAEEGAGVDLSWPSEGGLRTKVTLPSYHP